MTTSHKLLPGLLLLVLTLAFVSLARRTGEQPATARAFPRPADSSERPRTVGSAPLDPPPPAATERNPVGGVEAAREVRSIRISSSAGFALPTAVVTYLGARYRHSLDGSELSLPATWESFSLGAPGHVERHVSAEETSVSLVPDFLLTLRADSLRDRVRKVRLVQGARSSAGLGETAVWGFLGRDEWKFAANSLPFVESVGPRIDVRLTLVGHEVFRVVQDLEPNGRFERQVPLELTQLDSEWQPLTVEVRGASGRGEVLVELWCPQRFDSSSPEYLLSTTKSAAGLTQLYRPRFFAERLLIDGAVRAEFGQRPLGMDLVASAVERQTGAFARSELSYGDRIHTLTLAPGLILRGRLVPPPGRPLPERATFQWLFRGSRDADDLGSSAERFWNGGATLPIDDDGRFRVALPQKVPRHLSAPSVPPPWLDFLIKAPPYRTLELALARDAGEQDLGDLELSSDDVRLVLSGDGPLPDEGLAFEPLFARPVSASGSYLVRCAARSGRDLELQLNRRGMTDEGIDGYSFFNYATERFESRPSLDPAPAFFALLHGGAYERTADGRYRGLPTTRYEVRLDYPNGLREPPLLGWTWNGVFVVLPGELEPLSDPRTIWFEAPAYGVAFAWRERDDEHLNETPLPLPAAETVIPIP